MSRMIKTANNSGQWWTFSFLLQIFLKFQRASHSVKHYRSLTSAETHWLGNLSACFSDHSTKGPFSLLCLLAWSRAQRGVDSRRLWCQGDWVAAHTAVRGQLSQVCPRGVSGPRGPISKISPDSKQPQKKERYSSFPFLLFVFKVSRKTGIKLKFGSQLSQNCLGFLEYGVLGNTLFHFVFPNTCLFLRSKYVFKNNSVFFSFTFHFYVTNSVYFCGK